MENTILNVSSYIKISYEFIYHHERHKETIFCKVIEIVEVLNDKPEVIKVQQIYNLENYIKFGKDCSTIREFRVSEIGYDIWNFLV